MCKPDDEKTNDETAAVEQEQQSDEEPVTVSQFLTLAGKVDGNNIPPSVPSVSLLQLDHISKLDLFECGLSSLPEGFETTFSNLSILFLSNNQFKTLPTVIGHCPKLQMVAFRNNGMTFVEPEALQPQLRWLILTNNALTELPATIGRCVNLQKLMLCGNQLTSLPSDISNCQKLELIRMASNLIAQPPMELFNLPKLAWVAFSDNPFLTQTVHPNIPPLPLLTDVSETDGVILGQGAGGITRKVQWNDKVVAVKVVGATMTSDGLPLMERRVTSVACHLDCNCHIEVYGETPNGALVMEYLENFDALADPPSFETCSRDVYSNSPQLTQPQAEILLTGLLTELAQLHGQFGICHGDFYAHNILVHADDPSNVRLSDFGAAFFYDPQTVYGKLLQSIEVRAFGILVQEVAQLIHDSSTNNKNSLWSDFVAQCWEPQSSFEKVLIWWRQQQLKAMATALDAELLPPPGE